MAMILTIDAGYVNSSRIFEDHRVAESETRSLCMRWIGEESEQFELEYTLEEYAEMPVDRLCDHVAELCQFDGYPVLIRLRGASL